jgi:hypothetical protein
VFSSVFSSKHWDNILKHVINNSLQFFVYSLFLIIFHPILYYVVCSWARFIKSVFYILSGILFFIPFRRNALVPPPFPLVEAPLKVVFLQAFEQRCGLGSNRCHVLQMPPTQHQLALSSKAFQSMQHCFLRNFCLGVSSFGTILAQIFLISKSSIKIE